MTKWELSQVTRLTDSWNTHFFAGEGGSRVHMCINITNSGDVRITNVKPGLTLELVTPEMEDFCHRAIGYALLTADRVCRQFPPQLSEMVT